MQQIATHTKVTASVSGFARRTNFEASTADTGLLRTALMFVLGTLTAAATALCWIGLDTVRKRMTASASPSALVVWLCFGQAPLFALWLGFTPGFVQDWRAYLWPGGAAAALGIVANVLFLQALQWAPFSKAIPMLALTPVFSSLVGMTLLGERLWMHGWLGVVLVVFGAWRVQAQNQTNQKSQTNQESKERWGMGLMVLVAALWSLTIGLDKMALQHASVAGHGLLQSLGMGLPLCAWMLLRGRASELKRVREMPWKALSMVCFGVGALTLQLTAVGLLWVGLVETIKRAVGTLMSVAIGNLLFKENVTRQQWVGAVVMVIGATMVLLGVDN